VERDGRRTPPVATLVLDPLEPKMPSDRSPEASKAIDIMARYAAAVLTVVIALLLRALLEPLLGYNNPYHTVWLAVVVSTWYCGLGPAIVTTLLSLAGVWYWFLLPYRSFALQGPKAAISGMIGFLVFSGVIIALGETSRRSLSRSRWAEEQLRRTHDELERKVLERTADLRMANEGLRELSGRLQQMRDEEARRIARELHDSVGQLLAALSMNIAVLQRQSAKLDAEGSRAVSENQAMVDQITREIRTISHLLHPPLLDAAGLVSAIRWYVDGFSERSKIQVNLEIPEKFARLSDEMEIAIFRMVQECLTNIHRHSGGSSATIRMRQEDRRILVEVQDEGKGIPLEKQLELSSSGRTGVGFRGMRERLRQLGGTLELQSSERGTTVSATLPLTDSQTAGEHISEVA
jgi:signal transduction histidine kinase